MLRLGAQGALSTLVALSSMAVTTTPAAACVSAPAPFDSFSAAVPSAGIIVVGSVEGLADRDVHTRFRLRIDEVLRGDAPGTMIFSGLSGSDALSACGDRNVVDAAEGDRLALAMGAAVIGRPLEVEAVAFVGKSRPDRRAMPKVERLPLRRVRRLAGKSLDGAAARRPFDAGVAADNLIIEPVARGVARVSSRGTKHDLRAVWHLDIGPDGRAWAATRDSAYQLAQRKEHRPRDGLPSTVGGITIGPGGHALAGGSGVSLFERDRWRRIGDDGADDGPWSPLMTSSGTVWALSMRGPSRFHRGEWVPYGWDVIDAPAECLVPMDPLDRSRCDPTGLAEAPDGSVWLGFGTLDAEGTPAGGLRRLDGEAWGPVPDPMPAESFAVTHLTSYPGGPLWVLLVAERAALARWDGEAWTHFELPSELGAAGRDPSTELEAGPDGTVWLSHPLVTFDGDSWRRYDIPARASSRDPRIEDLSIAPDGSAWMVVRERLEGNATRRDGIYALDPDRALSRETSAR
ncbi:hypothetical protein BH23CHL8_BH23CHL8_03170 [soil metagenome]